MMALPCTCLQLNKDYSRYQKKFTRRFCTMHVLHSVVCSIFVKIVIKYSVIDHINGITYTVSQPGGF